MSAVRKELMRMYAEPGDRPALLKVKAGALLDAYKAEVQHEDAATLMWRIREALVYMSQVSQPNEHTLSHIRRYLRGENDGMASMSDGSELDKK